MKQNIKEIALTGAGTEIPNFNVSQSFEGYFINGTAVAIGNYAITIVGTPQVSESYTIYWTGTLDITTNSKTFSVLGQSLTQEQLNAPLIIKCDYTGSSWIVKVIGSLEEEIIDTLNIMDDAITTSKILNGAVTNPKLATDSVSTIKIQDDAVTTSKIDDLAVTNAKINDIDGSKIVDDSIIGSSKLQDNSVTDDKLSTGTAASVRYRDASGDIGNLPLGADELPIGNGTTVTTITKTNLVASVKQIVSIAVPISFEAGEQTTTKTCWFPTSGTYYLSSILVSVVKNIAGTDDAQIDVNFGSQPVIKFNTPNVNSTIIIPASTSAGTAILYSNTSVNSPVDRINPIALAYYFNLVATKTTAGGKIVATIVFHEI